MRPNEIVKSIFLIELGRNGFKSIGPRYSRKLTKVNVKISRVSQKTSSMAQKCGKTLKNEIEKRIHEKIGYEGFC